jgi:cytochrome b-561
MIAFRVFRNDSKPKVKLLHMIIQATAFAFGVVGLKAVFDFHNHNNINNMYSLHSWIGITAFVLFSCQVYEYVQSEYFSVKFILNPNTSMDCLEG